MIPLIRFVSTSHPPHSQNFFGVASFLFFIFYIFYKGSVYRNICWGFSVLCKFVSSCLESEPVCLQPRGAVLWALPPLPGCL